MTPARWTAIPSAAGRPKPNRVPFIMPRPIIVIASLLITIKSTWDMAREKRAAKTLKTETRSTLVDLLRAYVNEPLLEREFNCHFERLMRANAHNDGGYSRRTS